MIICLNSCCAGLNEILEQRPVNCLPSLTKEAKKMIYNSMIKFLTDIPHMILVII